MKVKKRFRPLLDALERRETPAITTRFYAGTITVQTDNTAATALTVRAVTGSNLQVLAGAIDLGTFNNVNNVLVNMGGGAGDNLLLNLNGNTVAANMTFNLGNGANDSITINNGTLTGRLNATFGTGTGDTFTVGTNAATTLNGAVNVRSSSSSGFNFVDALGTNAINSTINLTNVNNVTTPGAGSNGGSILINNSGLGASATVTIAAGVTFNGNLTYTGGAGASIVTINGTLGGNLSYSNQGASTIALGAAGIIGGNVTLNFGSNTNTYNTNSAGWIIGGSLAITAGDGANAIALAGTVGSGLTVTLGNGVNSLTLNAGSAVGGNLTYRGGNGGDTVALTAGTIGRNVAITLGNGTNAFTESNGFNINGSTVTYTGGTGSDTVTIDNPMNGYNLIVNTGGTANLATGVDTVTLTNVTSLASDTITFGFLGTAGVNKILNNPAAGYSWNHTEINYP